MRRPEGIQIGQRHPHAPHGGLVAGPAGQGIEPYDAVGPFALRAQGVFQYFLVGPLVSSRAYLETN